MVRKRLRRIISSESPERVVEQQPSSQPAAAGNATPQLTPAKAMREVQVRSVASKTHGISDPLASAVSKRGKSRSRSPPKRRQATPSMQKRSARGPASSVPPPGQMGSSAGPSELLRQAVPAHRVFKPSLRKASERGGHPSTAWTPKSSTGAVWMAKAKGDSVCHHDHRIKSEAAGCQWICADCGEILFFDGWRVERVAADERALRQQELHGSATTRQQVEMMQSNGDLQRPGWF
mmetsp:Transcript_44589/g.78372  ORF Transcript_44589/g.78372 Transcript_44589/m.78372 type:complete len:235 (-) Transcript_44589:97-801(-)